VTESAIHQQAPAERRDPAPSRLGVVLTTCHPAHWTQTQVFDNTTAMAQAADELGFDCAWLLEHHFTPYGLCPNTFTMAGYLLGVTRRIRVGSAVAVASLDHPVRIAEQVCLLDQLSHGRFVAGFGRGQFEKDFDAFGVDPSTSTARLQESIEILRQACTQRTIAWDSELYKLADLAPFPEPYTKPHPPIYVAAGSPSTIEWAASMDIPMLMTVPMQLETLRSRLELYEEVSLASHHDPSRADHVVLVVTHVADTREAAYQEIFDNLVWWAQEARDAALTLDRLKGLPNYQYHYSEIQSAIHSGDSDVRDFVRSIMDRAAVGTPEDCVERLRTLREATGIRNFALGFEGVLDLDHILRTMRRFAAEVLPHL
jgi:alkanal monooxygenase alpha chain